MIYDKIARNITLPYSVCTKKLRMKLRSLLQVLRDAYYELSNH